MTDIILHPDCVLLGGSRPHFEPGISVAVAGDTIAAIGAPEILRQKAPGARELRLEGQALIPGLVNAHQHGRGITALQLGFEDDYLEPWMAIKRRRLQIDPYLQTLYAALRMIANGVTSAIHANTVGGGPDYASEVDGALRAYADSGLRVMFGVGAMDRAELVYPASQQGAFLAGLPVELQAALGDGTRPVYCPGAEATLAMMSGLRDRFRQHPRISLAYAPAGPQWVSDALLSALAADARAHGTPIHMHALEAAAQIDAVRDCCPAGLMRHLDALGVLGPLTSFAHAVWLTADDAEIASRTGVTLVRNPGSNLRLHAGIAPLAHYVAAGVNVALGSDNTTLNDDEDLLTEARLARALTRGPSWDASPPLSAHQMWAMMTVNGARAMGLTGRVGEIAEGAAADLVALDLGGICGPYLDADIDLTAAVLGRATGSNVRLTMIGGDIVYRDGRFTHHDLAEIAERCQRAGVNSKAAAAPLTAAQAALLSEHLRTHYRSLRASGTGSSGHAAPIANETGWA